MFISLITLIQILITTYAIAPPNMEHPAEVPSKMEENPVKVIEEPLGEKSFHVDVSKLKNNMTAVVPANSKSASNTTIIKQDTIDSSDIGLPIIPKGKDVMDSGAMLRGFYVFLGLSLLTIFYFLFKTYRLRNGSQPPTQVRKYGVLTRRGDVEMLPLPLDDEDEDDTVFDLGNHSNSQNNRGGVFLHS